MLRLSFQNPWIRLFMDLIACNDFITLDSIHHKSFLRQLREKIYVVYVA